MNEELMKHVERIVRPVRAGRVRKLAIRRELLAHLTAICDEELATQGDEPAAVAAAIGRFGDPADVTRELQRTTGWRQVLDYHLERWAGGLTHWFSWRLEEPWWRFAIRAFAAVATFNSAIGMLLFLYTLLAPPGSYDPLGARLAGIFLLHATFSEWAFLLALRSTYRLVCRGSSRSRWPIAAAAIAAWSAGFALLGFGLWWHITGDLGDSLQRLPRILANTMWIGPASLIAVALAARHAERREAPYRQWSELEIE